MSIQKLIGWFLIVVGFVQIFQAIYLQSTSRSRPGYFFAFIVALLFATGASLLWRGSNAQSKT